MKNIQEEIKNDILKFIDIHKRYLFNKGNIRTKSVSPLSVKYPEQLDEVLLELIDEGKITETPGGSSNFALGSVPGYKVIK